MPVKIKVIRDTPRHDFLAAGGTHRWPMMGVDSVPRER
jgi:hypothetical protein